MCSGCGQEFRTRKLLEDHTRAKLSLDTKCNKTGKCSGKVSGARLIYPCKLCGKFFTRKDNLRNHLRTYTTQDWNKRNSKCIQPASKNKYDCSICGKSFGGSSLLSLHTLTHKRTDGRKANVSKIYHCYECGKGFSFLSSLKQHAPGCKIKTEVAMEQYAPRYKCLDCTSEFTSKVQLTGHSRIHSTLEKPHKCPFCDRRCLNPTQLRLHLLDHNKSGLSNNDKIDYFCSKCDLSFGNSHNLERHLWYTHSEIVHNTGKNNADYLIFNDSCNITSNKVNVSDNKTNSFCKIEVKVEPADVIGNNAETNRSTFIVPEGGYKIESDVTIKQEPIEEN